MVELLVLLGLLGVFAAATGATLIIPPATALQHVEGVVAILLGFLAVVISSGFAATVVLLRDIRGELRRSAASGGPGSRTT